MPPPTRYRFGVQYQKDAINMLSLAHLTAAFMITLMLLPRAFAAEIVAQRRAAVKPEQTVIITFFLDVAEAAKKKFPDRKVYWLHSYAKDKKTGKFPDLDEVIAKAKNAGVDGVDLEHKFPLDAAAIKKIKA